MFWGSINQLVEGAATPPFIVESCSRHLVYEETVHACAHRLADLTSERVALRATRPSLGVQVNQEVITPLELIWIFCP